MRRSPVIIARLRNLDEPLASAKFLSKKVTDTAGYETAGMIGTEGKHDITPLTGREGEGDVESVGDKKQLVERLLPVC